MNFESHGSVLRAGLVSVDRRRAIALVAVDATVKNIKAPERRPSHYRIQVDLVRDRESGRVVGGQSRGRWPTVPSGGTLP